MSETIVTNANIVNNSVIEMRCHSCRALLGKFVSANGEIKCKCGTLNKLSLVSQKELTQS